MQKNSLDDFFETEEIKSTRSFLEFDVRERTFAIKIEEVAGVFAYEGAKRVPGFAPYVKGVCTFGEQMIAVIDAAKRFAYDEECKDKSRRCVVAAVAEDENGESKTIGLLVDAAKKIRAVEEEKIAPPPRVNKDACTRFVVGSYQKTNGEICLVVSPSLMMSDEERLALLKPLEE